MDVLEKLKDLVSSGKDPKQILEQIEAAQKEEFQEVPELPDYLECTEEESLAVLQLIEQVKVAKLSLASLQILYEEKKSSFIEEIKQREVQLLQSLDSLRLQYSLPGDIYEASIPASPADKVSFTKKRSLQP
tara:strand:+ start:1598 stop:1993 length:396 start_codon:yes stop_codon:yes gene_type:complete